MVNYSNSMIYLIQSPDKKMAYIGHSVKKYLCIRKSEHKSCFRLYMDGKKKYYTAAIEIFKKYPFEECVFLILERVSCENKKDLLDKERHWLDIYKEKCECVNKHIPGNWLGNSEYKKEYRLSPERKNQRKYHYQQNKERLLKANREYRLKNPDKVKETQRKVALKKNTPVQCDCGATRTKRNLERHKQSKQHQNWENNQYNEWLLESFNF